MRKKIALLWSTGSIGKTTLEVIKRDKKKLYLPAIKGEKKNVVDVDIPFEHPENCDLEVDTENKNPEAAVKDILEKIKILN